MFEGKTTRVPTAHACGLCRTGHPGDGGPGRQAVTEASPWSLGRGRGLVCRARGKAEAGTQPGEGACGRQSDCRPCTFPRPLFWTQSRNTVGDGRSSVPNPLLYGPRCGRAWLRAPGENPGWRPLPRTLPTDPGCWEKQLFCFFLN